jgi:very-short-patch-repair endonuclease
MGEREAREARENATLRGESGSRPLLHLFARHQWVRLHGTPRVTVLAGDVSMGVHWSQWAATTQARATLLDFEDAAPSSDHDSADPFDTLMQRALAAAIHCPGDAIAVRAPLAVIQAWRRQRRDRVSAMVDEGLVLGSAGIASEVATAAPRMPGAAPTGRRARAEDLPLHARSAAEAALFEALEATAATAGRFELNGSLSVRFGGAAAEVDLLSRQDRIAIEIDGIHHFQDAERFRRDRRKDLLLQMQGLLVLRVLAEDVARDARDAVKAVCEALAYRGTGSAAASARRKRIGAARRQP